MVGLTVQLVKLGAVPGAEHNAHADGHHRVPAVRRRGVGQPHQQVGGLGLDPAVLRHPHHEHHKFIAAHAAHQIGVAEVVPQKLGHHFQHLVAVAVAVCIVDALEIVNVHHDHGAGHIAPVQNGLDALLAAAAGHRLGEHIGVPLAHQRVPAGQLPRAVFDVEPGEHDADGQRHKGVQQIHHPHIRCAVHHVYHRVDGPGNDPRQHAPPEHIGHQHGQHRKGYADERPLLVMEQHHAVENGKQITRPHEHIGHAGGVAVMVAGGGDKGKQHQHRQRKGEMHAHLAAHEIFPGADQQQADAGGQSQRGGIAQPPGVGLLDGIVVRRQNGGGQIAGEPARPLFGIR